MYICSFFTVLFHLFWSIHLFLFILFIFFSALAFTSLTGVVVVMVIKVLRDVVVLLVVFRCIYNANIHRHIIPCPKTHMFEHRRSYSEPNTSYVHIYKHTLKIVMFAVMYLIS